MSKLMKISLPWAAVAWLATTWVGALMGFLFAWSGILIVGSMLSISGDLIPMTELRPQFILWSIWAALFAMALIGMMIARLRGEAARLQHFAALTISLLALLVVVRLSLETMKSSWP